ncbi:hypothetical protein MKA48_08975 [[Clostridium] innocuum]|nr:hypothetical protein [[Clostridium] innocuum]
MHYTGIVWIPSYELYTALIQVTQGCTYDECKFCNLYNDIRFKVYPLDGVINELYPKTIEAGALTIFENTELCNEIQNGNFKIATKKEISIEMKTFIDNCDINCNFFANTVSNTVKLEGKPPKNLTKLSDILGKSINNLNELEIQKYRSSINHL